MTLGAATVKWDVHLSEAEENWDGTTSMAVVFDDGGRSTAGYRGRAGDCVARAIAIASRRPYHEVYDALAAGTGAQRTTRGAAKGRSARNGINTGRKWFKDYMASLGFRWTPTMKIGSGCTVHLLAGELPMGRLVVAVSKHYTTLIDGVIHDTHDPQRATIWYRTGTTEPQRMSHRCVYGYWEFVG